MEYTMKTSEFIRKARKRLGITQNEFAKRIGKSRCDIANYETGRTIPPGNVILKIQELENHQGQSA